MWGVGIVGEKKGEGKGFDAKGAKVAKFRNVKRARAGKGRRFRFQDSSSFIRWG